MKILFLHSNFPAQFRHLATVLGKEPANQVVFVTQRQEGEIAGVKKLVYQPSRSPHPETHHYVKPLERAVLEGQAVYRVAVQLKQQGFYPDVVYAHSGWGVGLFMKDIFPKARYLCYFEWFYHAHGSDADFDPSEPLDADGEARIRVKNAPILLDLASCNGGLTPTQWQFQQFLPEFRPKLKVLHDGIDTMFFSPRKQVAPDSAIARLVSDEVEVITYTARGMEPYRGFPQFMEAAALLQQRRPGCHVVVVGEDRVAYGKQRSDGKTYKEAMLESFDFDLSRLHFTGWLPYPEYVQVLQRSSVHVYLTRPFVLSWSCLEAMATGCLLVGSRVPPVEEVIEDGVNGFLVNFFSPEAIAGKVEEVLEHLAEMGKIRQRARETILSRFDLSRVLPEHLGWLMSRNR